MAELVCVYDLTPVPRTVEDILPALDPSDGDGAADSSDGDDQTPARALYRIMLANA